MKIVDLKCPHCGGKLRPVEGNSKIVSCEYCQSQYMLEDDRVINYHIHPYTPPKEDATPQWKADLPSSSTGAATVGVLAAALVGVFILILVSTVYRSRGNSGRRAFFSSSDTQSIAAGEGVQERAEEETTRQLSHSPFYDIMVEAIYGEPADKVAGQELEKLRYLRLDTGSDQFTVQYSFDDPYGEQPMEIQTLNLEPADWDKKDLAEFSNLAKVDLSYNWTDGDVFKELKNLKGLCCYKMDPQTLIGLVEPGQLVELGLEKPASLEGIGAFENLEILTLDRVESPDIRQLVQLKQLRELYIDEHEPSSPLSSESGQPRPMADYSALSVLAGLERLSLKSAAIRDFSFLKPLTALTDLSIEGSEAISLEPLGELPSLTTLRVAGNDSVRDYAPLNQLTGLTRLVIDKSTSQPDPDLSALALLEELDVNGFDSVSGLKNLGNLKSLTIHGSDIGEIQALSALSRLERLTCYNVWAYSTPLESLRFIDGMTQLKYLDLCGGDDGDNWGMFRHCVEVYGDISNVFNNAGLEELYLNECMFGIDFGKLAENPSLKVLQMKEVSIKKNIRVESYAGMMNVWYDDVSLDENSNFLTNYPGLKELYLDGKQLTDVSFATELKELERLGLCNNYITDLTPLNQSEKLAYLDIRQNPVNGTIEARNLVEILQ